MFSIKSRGWQIGLTLALWSITSLLSLTVPVSNFEYGLLLYIMELQPSGRELVTPHSIRIVPQWFLLLMYGIMLGWYVNRYTRSPTTIMTVLGVVLILFGLLMMETVLAVFVDAFLPVMFPALIMLLVSLVYWGKDTYRRLETSSLLQARTVSLDDVRRYLAGDDLRTAMTLLKQCPYSDEMLEVGYELGMLLESRKHWASALNLYHWLSQYDPGLKGFVTRIEEIRDNRARLLKMGISAPMAETTTPTIGYYRLLRKIAKGATSVMYEATDTRSHNRVALKVMRLQQGESPESDRIQHWLREAEIVAQLDHPNIVKIHDAEMDARNAYIAMDFISGYSMSQRLRRREFLTVAECLKISKAMLNALAVAHSHGVVHGDIKPANIMYDNVRISYILTDFGAAYSEQGERKGDNSIVGTPAYMSPEQLEGKRIDGRSDLFSLAVTLYHLLTGYQPFVGASLPELKRNIVRFDPDLDHLELPKSLHAVIVKALQKKPYMRFADAKQMLISVQHCEKQLEDYLRHNQAERS